MPTSRWLGWVLIAVAILMVAQTAWQQKQNLDSQHARQRSLDCLSAWAIQLADAVDARTIASSATTANRKQMDAALAQVVFAVSPVLQDPPKPTAVQQLTRAISRYHSAYDGLNAAVEAQTDSLQQHPYPQPPNDCR